MAGDLVRAAGFEACLPAADRAHAEKIASEARAAGLEPPPLREWSDRLGLGVEKLREGYDLVLMDVDMREINTRLLGCLPDARRVVIPNASHTIQFDAPEAMARLVLQFAGE